MKAPPGTAPSSPNKPSITPAAAILAKLLAGVQVTKTTDAEDQLTDVTPRTGVGSTKLGPTTPTPTAAGGMETRPTPKGPKPGGPGSGRGDY